MTKVYQGTLEIDEDRGVIYFHLSSEELINSLKMITVLRICRLPIPIPSGAAIDITHMTGCSYAKSQG